MSDPVLISQIITSLGLSGQEAEKKRQELEKLSNDELNKLLSNMSSYAPSDVGSFAFLNPSVSKFGGAVFNPVFSAGVSDLSSEFSSSSAAESKDYTSSQKKELDRFLGDFLYNSASLGYEEIKQYNDGIGLLNIKDRVVNGIKVIFGQKDRIELERDMQEAMKDAQKFRDVAYSQPGTFEFQIERKFGIPYSHANVEKLKQTSEEFTRVTAYHEKTELLKDGFSEVRKILIQEQEYEQARKYVRGAAAASLQPPEVSSHEKFGEVLLQFCNGDQNLVSEYMKSLTEDMGSTSEIEKNLPKIMDELIQKSEAQEKDVLGNKSYSQYKQEYETACKRVFGTEDYKETAENFVEKAKTQAGFTEIGLTIATSLLLPSSSIVRKGVQKAAVKYGERAAMNMMKGTMTAATGSVPAVLSTLNAATSEAGFTPETIEEIKEKFKNGLMYGGFGAYVSGPLGMAVEKVLSKNPAMLSNIVSKTMGAATETSVDVLFDRMTSDLSFVESLKQNGIMNFGMMIAGGQVNRVLSKLSVTKVENGAYSIKDETGKEVFKAEDENALAGYVIAKGLDDVTTIDVNESIDVKSPVVNNTSSNNLVLYRLKLANGRTLQLAGEPNMSKQQINQMVRDFLEKEKKQKNFQDAREIHYTALQPAFDKAPDELYKTRILDIDNVLSQFGKNAKIKEVAESMLKEFNKTGNYQIIDQLELYLDAISEINLRSVNLYGYQERTINGQKRIVREASYIQTLARQVRNTDNTTLAEWEKHLKNKEIPARVKQGGMALNGDMQELMRWNSAIRYMKKYPNTDIANNFYKYYLDYIKGYVPETCMQKIIEINNECGVKIIMPSGFNIPNAEKSLEILQNELHKWTKASDGQAKLPPVVMFNASNPMFIYGEGLANFTTIAASEASYGGSLVFPEISPEKLRSLRHELTHTNDSKLGENIPVQYNLDEIIPHKEINGPNGTKRKILPKIEECRYAYEFRNAGLSDDRILYAHTNTKEFIAVATEGDMSKYSPEFKQLLIDFGMPEWVFKLDEQQ